MEKKLSWDTENIEKESKLERKKFHLRDANYVTNVLTY